MPSPCDSPCCVSSRRDCGRASITSSRRVICCATRSGPLAAPFERQTPLALRALSERSPTTRGLLVLGVLLSALLLGSCSRVDSSKRLRILTWADYVPADVVAQFERETGIHVEVTLSNNEEMISKLHATGGAGYDLAQPSQDRITGVQREFGLYKPIDLTQVKLEQFRPEILAITRRIATLDGKLYALPYLWGAEGIVVNHKRAANVADYGDLCRPDLKGDTSLRLRR